MGKHFHLRISRVIPSICRSKNPSALVVPSYTPNSTTTIKRCVSSVSLNCGFRAKPKKHYITYYSNSTHADSPPRHKIALPSSPDSHVSSSPAFRKTKKEIRISNCSTEVPLFSSEDISRTYSAGSYLSSFSDSGTDTGTLTHELDSVNQTPIKGLILNKKKKNKRSNKVKRVRYYHGLSKVSPLGKSTITFNSPEEESLDEKDKEEEGKMKESFAVMKKSEDPYQDFKRSMMEMIVEKEMFETVDLEQLLHCFLSLNSRHHYGAIIEAFSDVWEILFSKSDLI